MWEYAVKTLKGIALDQKLAADGTLPLQITEAKTGSGTVSPTRLALQENVTGEKQELELKGAYTSEDGQTVTFPVSLTNVGLGESYRARQVGIYANDPTDGKILYIIAQNGDNNGNYIPSEEEFPGYSIDWYFSVKESNAENIEIVIDAAGHFTPEQGDLRYAKKEDLKQVAYTGNYSDLEGRPQEKYLRTCTLTVEGWQGDEAPYTQRVEDADIKESDEPWLVSMLENGAESPVWAAYMKAFGIVASGTHETGDGYALFKVYKKPTTEIIVGLKGGV